MDINTQTAQAIKALLEENRMSRNALADASGVPYTTLNRKLNGGGDFGLSEVARIAKALQVPVARILPRDLLEYKVPA